MRFFAVGIFELHKMKKSYIMNMRER